MTIRFQADADLNQVILLATIRREPAVDFQTPMATGLAGLSDVEVLTRAARDGRVLVTHDQTTMPHHFANFITNQSSPGVLIIPQHLQVSAVVDDLLLIWLRKRSARVGKYHSLSACLGMYVHGVRHAGSSEPPKGSAA